MKRPLRIFLSCQQANRPHAVPAYSFWADYFRGALAEAGHEIIEAPACDWAEGLLPAERPDHGEWLTRTWEQALSRIRREHSRRKIDLFLSYLFPAQVESAAITAIRELGIPCVNFFCDNVREFRRIPNIYHCFDLHWVPEHKALPLYRAAGLIYICAPMACWVPPKYRHPVEVESLPVTFVGTRDPTREELFAEAIENGLEVVLKGPGWLTPANSPVRAPKPAANLATLWGRKKRFIQQHGWVAFFRQQSRRTRAGVYSDLHFKKHGGDPVYGDSYWQALRNCSVCLGVNRYPSWRFPLDRPDTYSRLRDIEAPMAGACYLTEWTEGLDQIYEIGAEIEVYRSAEELVDKTRCLTRDAPRRSKLRVAGQKRALSDHSIANTLERICRKLS